MKHFDVLVIGGGHAGVEAAMAAARKGVSTALITFRREDLGAMSCNPAIGGIGKGHLVREIDALDGVMGLAADYAGIQFRLLNRSRGPAVQGPRVQADRKRYAEFVQKAVLSHDRVTLIVGEVTDIVIEDRSVRGVTLASGETVGAESVVLTSGTFLNGMIHIGGRQRPAGRVGSPASTALARTVRSLGVTYGRLKTGTPPRLKSQSIDWDRLARQEGDENPVMMSFLSSEPLARQVSCGITETNEQTHAIIRQNIHLSAMGLGAIEGVGPRYCPSVEDKVTRFREKPSHNVFLEPEGLDSDLVYPNGLSSSLPEEVQETFLRSIRGLEEVEIAQFGYAIEYDYVDPRSLNRDLSVCGYQGLYLAGQINGTTGYEEAAAQGLVAGFNAAAKIANEPRLDLDRRNSYIGVMIDDLVSKGVSEPYRMFTSRAENRLVLRADNADQRLTPLGVERGLVKGRRTKHYNDKANRLAFLRNELSNIVPRPSDYAPLGLLSPKDGKKRSVLNLLGQADADAKTIHGWLSLENVTLTDLEQIRCEALYAPYEERHAREESSNLRRGDVRLPDGIRFEKIPSLSAELVEKLNRLRPASMAEAEKIEGMTPAALAVLYAYLRLSEREKDRVAKRA